MYNPQVSSKKPDKYDEEITDVKDLIVTKKRKNVSSGTIDETILLLF